MAEAIVDVAPDPEAAAVIGVIALAPFVGECPALGVHRPARLHVVDRPVVAIDRAADQKPELTGGAAPPAVSKASLARGLIEERDVTELAGDVAAGRPFGRLGDQVDRPADCGGVPG